LATSRASPPPNSFGGRTKIWTRTPPLDRRSQQVKPLRGAVLS
jgi:hypothetical protein